MATARIYLGNVPFDVTDDGIRTFLAPRTVKEVKIVTDRDTGRPRGFAFVEMADDAAVGPGLSAAQAPAARVRPTSMVEARPSTRWRR